MAVRMPQTVNQILSDLRFGAENVQAFNEGLVYGTADLAGLANPATGELNLPQPLMMLGTPVGGGGAALGFGNLSLTLSETNMELANQINNRRVIVVRGYGVSLDSFPTYVDAQGGIVDNLQGWHPRVLRDLSFGLVLSYKTGTRNEYEAGPIRNYPAGEFGAAATAVSTTVNASTLSSLKTGQGSMVRFDTPEGMIGVPPNGVLDFRLKQMRSVFLTSDGLPFGGNTNPARISSARIQVILEVFDIEGVSN